MVCCNGPRYGHCDREQCLHVVSRSSNSHCRFHTSKILSFDSGSEISFSGQSQALTRDWNSYWQWQLSISLYQIIYFVKSGLLIDMDVFSVACMTSQSMLKGA
jgi:hypothetical protein